MSRSLNLGRISTRRQRIAKLAREDRERSFLSLAHYIDVYWLHEAFSRTRKDGAPGVDGQTAADYAKDLGSNLRGLLDRFKSGRYKAPPVRRRHIPKGSDRRSTRPIGIPTLEDKVLQRAVSMVLESVYEEDFLDCSYGYRPRRSAHQALETLWQGLMEMGGGWVWEVDIQRFFDELDRRQLRGFLDRRVRDGVKRYGLRLHPDKTRLLRFQRPQGQVRPPRGPRAFEFLGFTHHWGRSRRGNWVVQRKTATSRLSRALGDVRSWCRRHRHQKLGWQQQKLAQKLRGHYAYYGVTGNYRALDNFYRQVHRIWRKGLDRRSHKARMIWERFNRLLGRYPLPRPRIVHSFTRA